MFRIIIYITITYNILFAQTTLNPNISAIGDLILTSENSVTSFSNSGVELAFEGYVNPFARASVYIHKHDGEAPAALEEAYLSVDRGLPWGLQIRAGRMFPELGRLNREHSHLWPYILPSESMQNILGPEFWSTIGVEIRYLLPLPWFSNLTTGIFQDGIQLTEESGDSPAGKTSNPSAINLRWSNFWDFSSDIHGEFGMSHYRSNTSDQKMITGFDYKMKWRPDNYRSIFFSGEMFISHPTGDSTAIAGLSVINGQFNRVWNVGLTGDFLARQNQINYSSVGGFVGFSPAAESSVIRLMVKQINSSQSTVSWQFVTQLIWSLGPHKPHQF